MILATTLGGKEAVVARDLCDCLYGNGDTAANCAPIYPGLFFAEFGDRAVLDKCLSMSYFKKLIKRIELYDAVLREAGVFDRPNSKKIGPYVFIRL